MALTSAVFQAALASYRAVGPYSFNGVSSDRLIAGISQALATWVPTVGLTGAVTGSLGTGVVNPVTTRLIVASNPGIVQGALTGAGLQGPLVASLAQMVSGAVSSAFSQAGQYIGTSAGVGVGQDVSKVTQADAGILRGLLLSTLAGTLGSGLVLPQLIDGLAQGVSLLILSGGSGTGTVTGTPGPSPGSGVTTSTVV